MRKIIILILLFVFISVCLLINKKNDEVIAVFSEQDYNYQIYDIDVSKSDITTKNISKYFNNYTIVSINPYNNPIYEKNISIDTYNFDTNKSIDVNISDFTEMYLKVLYDHHYMDDYYKLNYSGIKIDKVSMYITKNELALILSDKDFKVAK